MEVLPHASARGRKAEEATRATKKEVKKEDQEEEAIAREPELRACVPMVASRSEIGGRKEGEGGRQRMGQK